MCCAQFNLYRAIDREAMPIRPFGSVETTTKTVPPVMIRRHTARTKKQVHLTNYQRSIRLWRAVREPEEVVEASKQVFGHFGDGGNFRISLTVARTATITQCHQDSLYCFIFFCTKLKLNYHIEMHGSDRDETASAMQNYPCVRTCTKDSVVSVVIDNQP